jgi:hypothetical protein
MTNEIKKYENEIAIEEMISEMNDSDKNHTGKREGKN